MWKVRFPEAGYYQLSAPIASVGVDENENELIAGDGKFVVRNTGRRKKISGFGLSSTPPSTLPKVRSDQGP
jgi:hypothetical protein